MAVTSKALALTLAVLFCATVGGARADVNLFPGLRPPLPPQKSDSAGPSPVIYPPQRLPLKFSHARHLRRGATCVTCHTQALSSVSAKDDLLPAESACKACHPIDRQQPEKRVDGPPAACRACHAVSPDERVFVPPPALKFNHRLHADARIGCAVCHGDLSSVDLATRAQLPRMSVCLSCHRQGPGKVVGESGDKLQRLPTARCAACHLQKGDGTLEQVLPGGLLVPSGELRGDDHGMAFRRQHRQAALNDPDYCQSCHTQSYCQRCHNGVVKPLDLHGGDYLSRHGQEARRNQPDCSACHRLQTFCIGCHERLGVASHSTLPGSPSPSAFSPAAPRRFHPDGWVSLFAGANLHAQEAQRNLRSCTSCHREDTCLSCHSSLSDSRVPGGVNPHPPDWTTSGRCRAMAARNARMCLKCHRDGSSALSCGG